MATFRSKEDGAKDQVPLHCFQERIGAFHAMIQMISNRMDSEVWILGNLQASLCKLVSLFRPLTKGISALTFADDQEQDIDQMISDAKIYEDDQGMKRIPDDEPQIRLLPGVVLTKELESQLEVECNRARQNKIQKRKQRRTRDLLTSLNRLSASLFAAIGVVERQIAILRDLHSLFLTNCRTKIKDYGKGYPLHQNPFYNNISPIPILSENSEHLWPNTLDTIDEVIRERESFTKKVKVLVENMDIRRKIV